MSMIKRYIDDECERIANKTGYTWDDVMDALVESDFNIEKVEKMAIENAKRRKSDCR